MQKAIEIGKTSVTGSFQLFVGMAASTIITALGIIILARLMTPEEYGLYSVALIPSSMTILFRDWGINSAIIKYAASLRAQKSEEKIYEIIVAGLIFEIATGFVLSVILVFLSGFIASTVLHRPESAPLIAIASAAVFAGAPLTAAQSAFIGFNRMELNSLTNVCQATVKSAVALILVFIGYGATGATLGYTISFIASATIGLATLYLTIIRRIRRKNPGKSSIAETIKKMLHYGVPLSISSIIGGFLIQFYAFLMAIYCTNTIIGNYQVAIQFSTILTFFTIPISTVLLPAFSKIAPQNEHELIQTVFTSSIKYTAVLLVPTTMAVMVLSKPIVSTLFGEKWVYAPFFLTLYVINNLFAVFGSLSLSSFLASVGETKTLMKLSLITMAFGISLALILIPAMGILGLILTTIVASRPSMIIGLYLLWKRYQVKADLNSSARILVSSTISATTTYMLISVIGTPDWVKLLIGVTTFLILYLTITPLIKAVNKTDVRNLKIMFSDLGIISKLINIPLNIAEKIAKP